MGSADSPNTEVPIARPDEAAVRTNGTAPAGKRWSFGAILNHPRTWIAHLFNDFRHETPREQLAIVYYVLGVSGALFAGVLGLSHHFISGPTGEAPSLLTINRAIARENAPEEAKRATDRLMQIVGELSALRIQEPALAPDIDAAFADLAKGNTTKAESILRKRIAQSKGADTTAQRKRAEYHRYLAAVVFLQSKQDALRELQAGAKDDPDNFKIWRDLGDVALAVGDSAEAERAYSRLLELTRGNLAREPMSLLRFGDVLKVRGDMAAASGAYRQATKLIEEQIRQEPANAEHKHDLSIGLMKIGDVLRDRGGDRDSALKVFRRSMAILQDLTKTQPANPTWQNDLAECYIRVGDLLRDKGDHDGALETYENDLARQREIAGHGADDMLAQRQIAIALRRISVIEKDRGNLDAALKNLRESLSVVQKMVDVDQTNANWQNDRRIALILIGDTLRAKGDQDSAQSVYQEALGIAKQLVARDSQNAEWQRGLALTYDRIGDILSDQGRAAEALETYGQGLKIRSALVNRDPSNTLWQRSLQVGTSKLGDTYKELGNHDAAVKSYETALVMAQNLVAHDPSNVLWHCDVAEMRWDLAELGIEPTRNLQAIVQDLEPLDQKSDLSNAERKFLLLAKKKLAG